MAYKLGLKLWSINTNDYYREAKRLYAEGTFDYIELYIVPGTLDTLSSWKALNIPFIIHAPHFMHGFNLAKKEKEKSNFGIYREVKQFADELNALFIIFHGGIDGSIKETAGQLASFNEARALIENKPCVALPNEIGGEFCRGCNINEIKFIKEAAKCGFCLDFGHAICAANSFELNIYEYCKRFLQFNPNMFHLADLDSINSPYDSHLHLGAGNLDFKQIFDMIPDRSYVTFETVKNSKKNLNDFIEDIEWLRNFQ